MFLEKLLKRGADIWDKWNPKEYNDTYYQEPAADTYETLDFLHRSLRDFKNQPFKKSIEIGSGPTLFGALGVEPYVKELHIADYLEKNLQEIEKWKEKDGELFNWDICIKYLLSIEGDEPTQENVLLREENLRKKIKKLLVVDIRKKWPLKSRGKYDLVVSLFCADSITRSKKEWRKYVLNIFNLANPGGVILLGALRNCKEYRVGTHYFPSANVNEKDMEKVILESKLAIKDIQIEVKDVAECKTEGFTSTLFAKIVLK